MKLFAQHSTRIKQSYATRTASHPFLDQRTILRTIAHTMRPGHHACVRRQMASRALRGLTRLARRCERVCTSRIRNAVFATPSSNARKTVKTPYLASDGNRSPIFCQSSREMQAAASPSGSPSTLRICCKRRRRAALRSSRRAAQRYDSPCSGFFDFLSSTVLRGGAPCSGGRALLRIPDLDRVL